MSAYPLLLDLAGRQVVVVGGGPVAARRVGGLVDAGAPRHRRRAVGLRGR